MATIYDLKPKFQAMIRPQAARLVRAGVTANAVTGFALALSLVQGALIALWPDAHLGKSARLGLGRLAQNGMPISASASMKQAQARSVVIARTWFHRIQARR